MVLRFFSYVLCSSDGHSNFDIPISGEVCIEVMRYTLKMCVKSLQH